MDYHDKIAEQIHAMGFPASSYSAGTAQIADVLRKAFPAPAPSPQIGANAPGKVKCAHDPDTLCNPAKCDASDECVSRGVNAPEEAGEKLDYIVQAIDILRVRINATNDDREFIAKTARDYVAALRAQLASEQVVREDAESRLTLARAEADSMAQQLAEERAKREGEPELVTILERYIATPRMFWETMQPAIIAEHLPAFLRELVTLASRPAPDVTALRKITEGLVNIDWCIGYELTADQCVELDRIRSLAAALLRSEPREEPPKQCESCVKASCQYRTTAKPGNGACADFEPRGEEPR